MFSQKIAKLFRCKLGETNFSHFSCGKNHWLSPILVETGFLIFFFSKNILFFNFEIIEFSMIYYDIVIYIGSENIQSACSL